MPLSQATVVAVCSGGMAGITVDVVLFPLDTIKTRLQSAGGFTSAGGFHGVYRGLFSTVVGSAPAGESITAYSWPEYDAPSSGCVLRHVREEQARSWACTR